MMYSLSEAHQFSVNHKDKLRNDKKCGCFYCLSIYDPKEIQEWIDLEYGGTGTALCPYCGVDSVIGESSGFPVTKEFLREMRDFWF